MKKKVAILYSGQPRSIEKCWLNHYKNLIETNSDFEIDVIAHFWWDDELENQPIKEILDGEKSKWDKKSVDFFKEKWQPRKILLEKPKEFEDHGISRDTVPSPPLFDNIQHVLSMFYSIKQANKLKKIVEKENSFVYDFVVRMRTDIIFDGVPIDFSDLEDNVLYVEKTNCHKEHDVSALARSSSYAINDLWAVGSSEIMDKYSETFDNYKKLIDDGCTINAECFLGYSVKNYYRLDIEEYACEEAWVKSGLNKDHAAKFKLNHLRTWIARHKYDLGMYVNAVKSPFEEYIKEKQLEETFAKILTAKTKNEK